MGFNADDIKILSEIGTFLGGFGNIFKGIFDVLKTILGWVA